LQSQLKLKLAIAFICLVYLLIYEYIIIYIYIYTYIYIYIYILASDFQMLTFSYLDPSFDWKFGVGNYSSPTTRTTGDAKTFNKSVLSMLSGGRADPPPSTHHPPPAFPSRHHPRTTITHIPHPPSTTQHTPPLLAMQKSLHFCMVQLRAPQCSHQRF
jgi:hypothetical protein